MKRIIAIIFAATFAVFAFAKDAATLAAEYKAIAGTGPELFLAQRAFALANKADILAVFNEWKTTADAELSVADEIKNTSVSAEQREVNLKMRHMYAKLFDQCWADMDASDLVIAQIGSGAYFAKMGSSWYDRIKAAGFVVNGRQLDANDIFMLVRSFGDSEYILSLPIESVKSLSNGNLRPWVEAKAKALLRSSNRKAAFQESQDIQDMLMFRPELSDSLKLIQNVQDEIYLRIKRANFVN